jgi:hypothetical protein
MIHARSLGQTAQYYGERTALPSGAARPTFRELHDRVAGIAAALGRHGFRAGNRLAMLLGNGKILKRILRERLWGDQPSARMYQPETFMFVREETCRKLRNSVQALSATRVQQAFARSRTDKLLNTGAGHE